jgi:hypothetical protein
MNGDESVDFSDEERLSLMVTTAKRLQWPLAERRPFLPIPERFLLEGRPRPREL